MRHRPVTAEHLEDRLRTARALVPSALATVRELYPDREVISVVVNGSFLWSTANVSEVDLGVVVEGAPRQPLLLQHHPELPLPDSGPVCGLDLLVVDIRVLEGATPPGRLADWRFDDGRPYPYDVSRATVASAVRCTYAVAPTVHGPDVASLLPMYPPNLLALAYYFVQEASVLLAYRELMHKAPQRLLEANLILNSLAQEDRALIDACANAALAIRASAEPAADLVATIQGWLASTEASLLDRTVRRLFRLAHELEPRAAEVTAELTHFPWNILRSSASPSTRRLLNLLTSVIYRARLQGEPAWQVLAARYRDWSLARAAEHAVAVLSTPPSAVLAVPRVHRALLAPASAPARSADEMIAHLLLWSALEHPGEVWQLDELPVSELAYVEAATQLIAYSQDFLEGNNALEVLGETP